jgi:hypothetical protein
MQNMYADEKKKRRQGNTGVKMMRCCRPDRKNPCPVCIYPSGTAVNSER